MKKILAVALAAIMTVALVVVASAIHNPDDTTVVWKNSDEFKMSWDTIYINGQSHMELGWGDDGSAPGKLEAHQPLSAADIETFTIRGWAGLINGTVAVWGYKINEGAPVFDESFTKPTEQPVIDAGGDSRFEIVVPVGKPSAPTLITAVAKDENGNVYDFIEFSLNGQYEKAPEQPAGSSTPAGEDQWICGVEPVAEEGQVTTGWWFNPVGAPDDRYLEVNFTAASYFSGVHGYYYCSNPDANPTLGLEYAHMTLQLIKDGWPSGRFKRQLFLQPILRAICN